MTARGNKKSLVGWSVSFFAVLLISLLYHLPAQWVVKQTQLLDHLPKNVVVSEIEGRVWQGTLHLSVKQHNQDLGRLHWGLSPGSLLGLKLKAQMRLEQAQGGARWALSTSLLNPQSMHLEALEGQWPLQELMPLMPPSISVLAGRSGAQGQLSLDQIDVQWAMDKNWPTSVQGNVHLSGVDLMGVQIPKLKIEPELIDQTLSLKLNGGGDGWQIGGTSKLTPKSFNHQVTIRADQAAKMPSWVELFMRRNSPVLATLNQKGRW
ncbi:type II secretion system protein N [Thiomicrorhabdus sp. zzn3]|uniref:type II secretion system protein N n=1 Tax=Thiomicrorhabdus sp. zzn3 TaxID=3039775 RepID=UPI0024370FE3|nr:type II secretion system protein N [Thiomicrorhabdus sp. zzn3]MDG6777326.1 type II secretion system protein N [Thiomicrorhabdus sp. zzn3]